MIIVWKLRGLNKAGKIKEVSSRLLDLNPEIAILIETRVKENKEDVVRTKLEIRGSFIDNYNKYDNGRLWVYWNNDNVDIKVVKVTNQIIHYGFYVIKGNWKYWMTIIYALNHLERRKKLWQDVKDIHNQQQGPWFLTGDFNNVLKSQDIIGGKVVIEK